MEEVTLDNMKARLKELGFTESRIAKAIADAIERSKTSGAVYLYRKDYHSAVIQMDNGSSCRAGRKTGLRTSQGLTSRNVFSSRAPG
jgi:hypothetical protein